MSDYTPTTDEIRLVWRGLVIDAQAFDRWLVEHDRKTGERAFGEGIEAASEDESFNFHTRCPNPYSPAEQRR